MVLKNISTCEGILFHVPVQMLLSYFSVKAFWIFDWCGCISLQLDFVVLWRRRNSWMNKSQEAWNLIVLLKHADMQCLVTLCRGLRAFEEPSKCCYSFFVPIAVLFLCSFLLFIFKAVTFSLDWIYALDVRLMFLFLMSILKSGSISVYITWVETYCLNWINANKLCNADT